MPAATIIGVDCACDPRKVGLALAIFDGGCTTVKHVTRCSAGKAPAELVVEWITENKAPVLIALDSPLGWPAPLGASLAQHHAGCELGVEAHSLFRRETDRFVKLHVRKQTLDVGADRIARTAHSALELLGALRRTTGQPIPLVWGSEFEGVGAIEVYPAATLIAHGISPRGYKGKDGREGRRRITEEVRRWLSLPSNGALLDSDDILDAVVCVLAAHDFLSGESVHPKNASLAGREGWIWVRNLDV